MPDHKRSDGAREWRKLYNTARWQAVRLAHLAEHPLCAYCLETETIEPATVVDHIKPHKGDLDLFWNPSNLQSLCASCHDGRKQREERGLNVVSFRADGWPA